MGDDGGERARLAGAELTPDHVLVDGRRIPELALPQTRIVGGDRKSFCIAAASIIAKVTRDRMMLEYDAQYPEYGFARHKGYCTAEHFAALDAARSECDPSAFLRARVVGRAT